MSEYKTPTTEQEFEENFAAIKPLMNSTQAYYESSRCLFCYNAPCTIACPAAIDIPLFIRQIQTQNLVGAARTIYQQNYMGNTCAKVCPTEALCEGACVFNKQNVKALEIGRLQNYATHNAIESNIKLFETQPDNGKSVAIIGAGPAGLACASELRLLGYTVEVFDSQSKPTGLVLHGVAPYKITNEEALQEAEYLKTIFGFNIQHNNKINTVEKLRELESKFDAIFLGIGLGGTELLRVAGEDKVNCEGATEFIANLKTQHLAIPKFKKVIVLGGGNTAMDAASECARIGVPEVTLVYRRSKSEMKAYHFEYDLAKAAGVKAIFNVQPVEIIGNEKVEGVKFIRTQSVGGKLTVVENSEFVLDCDFVIKATGQAKNTVLYSQITGLQTDSKGRILINEATGQTHNPKYFAGGDAVNGGAEVVNAAADGKRAGKGIHLYISGL